MVGAPLLAARAALKSGVGKVLVGFAQKKCPINCDLSQPELMLANAEHWLESSISIKAWVVGCGLGQDDRAKNLLKYLIECRLGKTPLVLDADALNLLSQKRIDLNSLNKNNSIILTPHVAEASRLLNLTIEQIEINREKSVLSLCNLYNKSWVILKGPKTLICQPNGSILCNKTGNVGLATSGSGDVLSGIIGSLIAQGLELREAIPGAVWLHGIAAEELSKDFIGPIGLTAGELINRVRRIRNSWDNKRV